MQFLLRYGWLILITLFAFWIRAKGLDFGLPNDSRPDETALINVIVYHLGPSVVLGDFALHPQFLYHPTLFMYLLLPVYLLYFKFGGFADYGAFVQAYQGGNPVFYLIPRWASVIAGTLTIPAMYWLGRIAHRHRTGIVAAMFTAAAYLLVRNSHFGTMDMLLTLLVASALAAMLLAFRKHDSQRAPIYWRWAAVLTGLALGTKYIGGLLFAPLVFALYLSKKKPADIAKTVGIGLLAFAVTTPWALFDFAMFREHLMYGISAMGGSVPGSEYGLTFYPRFALWRGLGAVIYLLAAAGIYDALYHQNRQRHWILLSALGAFMIPLALHTTVMTRYVLPVTPVVLFYAASGLNRLVAWVHRKQPGFSRPLVAAVLIAIAVFQPLSVSSAFNTILTQADTRNLARQWILEHAAPQTPVATGPRVGQIRLPPEYGQLVMDAAYNNLKPPPRGPQDVETIRQDDQTMVITSYLDTERMKAWGIRYVVIYRAPGLDLFANPPWELEFYRQRYESVYHVSPLKPGRPYSGQEAYDALDAFFLPFTDFAHFERPGPEIFIFDLDQPLAPAKKQP